MEFTYVLAGWEGSAHDGTVLRDAQHNHGFKTPTKKYWLVWWGKVDCNSVGRNSPVIRTGEYPYYR
jgi:hypothetical protein